MVSTIPVVDTDNDGLLDVWETKGIHLNTTVSPATFGGCSDYPSEPCLNLPQMGAVNGKKDLFIHIDWMHQTTPPGGTGGTDKLGSHDHMPKSDALGMVCQTYANNGVSAHFDVGGLYQGQPCIVQAAYSHGGNDIDEQSLICPVGGQPLPPPNTACTYTETYSVVGWKGGFQTVRDGHINGNASLFKHFEKDAVHYLLMGHAQSGPFCPSDGINPLIGGNPPCTPGTRLTTDPKSVSGIADRPGGDVLITFGLWGNSNGPDDKVGTSLQQAGTILHEVGHNLGLFHGGLTPENCQPNYFSSMSYLFQTRGLDDSNGFARIGYSYGLMEPLNEGALTSNDFTGNLQKGPLQYKPRFYAPLNSTNTPDQMSNAHCDGSPITDGAQMILVESGAVASPDWSNGTLTTPYSSFLSDINFNGVQRESYADVNDWASLNFQQISARLNFFGLSTDSGISDSGISDSGISDSGISDSGISDSGISDSGISDSGISDSGISDSGISDSGISDSGISDSGSPFVPEIDAVTLVKSGAADPPATLTPVQDLNDIDVSLTAPSVVAPGATVSYNVYRCNAASGHCDPAGTSLFLSFSAQSLHNGGSCTFTDNAPCFADIVNDTNPYHAGATCPAGNTCYNTTYTYKIITVQTIAGIGSGSAYSLPASDQIIQHLFVIASDQGHITYGAAIPTATSTTFPAGGSVAGVTCAYYPSGTPGTLPLPASVTPRNVGTYAILCTGPVTASANVGVSYNVTYLTNVPGALTIDQRHISVTAGAANKVYDGTTSCANGACTSGPAITTGSLGYTSAAATCPADTLGFTETYDNKNVLTPQNSHVMTPTGTVNDCNGGANYAYDNFYTIHTGTITPAALTITASTNTKTYDGTVSAAAIPATSVVCGASTITGPPALCTDTIMGLAEAYTDANAGASKTLTVSAGFTINDGVGGVDYKVTLVSITGIINPAPVTATAGSYSGTYDGSAHSTSACMVTGTAPATFKGTVTCANNPASVGPGASPIPTAVIPVPAVGPGDSLNNYAITSVNGSWSIALAPSTTTVTCPAGPYVYNGAAQTPCSATVTGAGGLSLTPTPIYSNNTNAGSAMASYTFAGDANHTGSSGNSGFTINPAPQSIAFAQLSSQPFGIADFAVTATATSGLPVSFAGIGELRSNAGGPGPPHIHR